MNYYDSSRFPAWSIAPLTNIAKLYNYVRFGFSVFHNKKAVAFREYQKKRPKGIQPTICYAPFKNLYFGFDGNVSACCMNRSHLFGKYPEQSLKEIWESKPVTSLRSKLKNYDFSSGCESCLKNIESRNFDAVNANLYDIIPSDSKYPVIMEFELSNTCNLQCIMCTDFFSSALQHTKTSRHNNVVYDDAFLTQLDEFLPHLKRVKFLGGEPFLIPVYFKICNRLIEVNPDCIIIIQTNATILNDKIKTLLGRGNFRISFSIDSFQKETYEAIRVNSNFEETMHNMDFFRAHAARNNYHINIAICPMQQNWKELPAIVKQCNQWDALVFFNTVWNPASCSLFSMPLKNLNDVLLYLSSTELPANTLVEKRNKAHFDGLLNQLSSWVNQKKADIICCKEKIERLENEKKRFQNISIDEILEALRLKLLDYSNQQNDPDCYLNFEAFSDLLNSVLLHFAKDYYLKKTVYELSNRPIEQLLQNIKNTNKELLTAKFESMILSYHEEEKKLNNIISMSIQ